MRLVLQRVKSASVSVNGVETAVIGAGMLVLVGLAATDTPELVDRAASKLLSVRLWDDKDANKPWAKNVVQQGMELLLVSQFTLCGRLKGNKPDWCAHAPIQPACARAPSHLTSGPQPALAGRLRCIRRRRANFGMGLSAR